MSNRLGYSSLEHAPNGNGQGRSTRCGTPRRDPRRAALQPHGVRVRAHNDKVYQRDKDENMNDHASQGTRNQYTKVHADLADIEAEQIRQDEEEDTDGRHVDQDGDDSHDDDLDLFDCAHQCAAGLEHVAEHAADDDDGEQAVCGQGVDNVLRHKRVEHVDDYVMDLDVFTLFEVLFVLGVDAELVVADSFHELRPDKGDEEGGVRDGDDGCRDVVADSPLGEFASFALALGHFAEALDG